MGSGSGSIFTSSAVAGVSQAQPHAPNKNTEASIIIIFFIYLSYVKLHSLTSSITFKRAGGGGDFTYEFGIVVNDILQRDSLAVAVLASANDTVTLGTLPISRDLVAGDTIKVQLNSLTNSTAITINSVKTSVT